jgi:uncharacterized protein
MLLGLFGGIAFAGFFAVGLGYQPTAGRIDYGMMLVSAISFHGVGLLWLNWFLRDHEVSWITALGLGSRRLLLALSLGLLTGIVGFFVCHQVGGLVTAILSRFEVQPELQITVQALRTNASLAWIVAFGVISIILAPLVEEFIFRGLLFPILKQLGFVKLAWWGTSLLFALIHFNLHAFLPLTVLALMLTWLYDRTDNLLAPILAHSAFNAVNFALTVQTGAFSSAGATP